MEFLMVVVEIALGPINPSEVPAVHSTLKEYSSSNVPPRVVFVVSELPTTQLATGCPMITL